ncbi:hypothetical protein JKF63_06536 [Porcisia hertigi]|uniref:Uncharacterized protein n=1 Tax=Porcisia hertigi TaxID=2761500 RepID=A0A836IKI8_9TRYP|nr:hypothetical protein JKF63_06536 [Porcisia hertigi]
MWEGGHTGPRWSKAAVIHRTHSSTASAANQAGNAHSSDEDDAGCVGDRGRLSTPLGKAHGLSSSHHADVPWFSSLRRRSEVALPTGRSSALTPLIAAASASSSTARSHSPAVWVFEEEHNGYPEQSFVDEGCAGAGIHSGSFGSDPRRPQRAVLQRRSTLVDSKLVNVGAVQASSPRVVDNRLCFFSPPVSAGEGGKSSRQGPSCHAPRVETALSFEACRSQSQTSSRSDGEETSDAATGVRSLAINAGGKPGSQPSSRLLYRERRNETSHARGSATESRLKEEKRKAPTSYSMRGRATRSPRSRTVSRVSSRSPPSSSSSSSSSSLACSVSTPPPSPPPHSVKAMHMANAGHASSPPGTTEYMDEPYLAGLGPLMVVHLDAVSEPGGTRPSPLQEGVAGHEVVSAGDVAPLSPSAPHVHPVHADPYWGAVVAQQEADTHEREVTALHARLESVNQQLRITEQQVVAAAEAQAMELVKEYKADERRRRTQFQAALDALREENRDLTARLEAAARAPVMGVPKTGTCPLWTSSSDAVAETSEKTVVATSSPLVESAAGIREVELTRRLQSVEAYWRDRLRTAERHWEDEVSCQTRQRREALDQVEELVHTVEQLQEELRYTRRQAARLREENARLCSTSLHLPEPSGATLSPDEVSPDKVARLRQAVKDHQHKEAAFLAQVESYSEEATRVRLRYEAALEKAEQQLAAEQRRSTEMVKLYGSQLESLHQQLREAKSRSAAP